MEGCFDFIVRFCFGLRHWIHKIAYRQELVFSEDVVAEVLVDFCQESSHNGFAIGRYGIRGQFLCGEVFRRFFGLIFTDLVMLLLQVPSFGAACFPFLRWISCCKRRRHGLR